MEHRPGNPLLVNDKDDKTDDIQVPEKSSKLKKAGFIGYFVIVFLFFVLMKLPEIRIQNYVLAHIRIQAQQHGLLFNAEKSKLSLIFGPANKFYNVEITPIDDPSKKLVIPYLKVSPSLLSYFSKNQKVSFSAEMLDGEISGVVGASKSSFMADLDIDEVDLSKTDIIGHFAPVDVKAVVDGSINIDMDLADTRKSEGEIDVEIENLNVPAQSVMGFELPKIGVHSSTLEMDIKDGRFIVKGLNVGKKGKKDDLIAELKGSGTIDKNLARSRFNGNVEFELSNSVSKKFGFLLSMIKSARRANGKYAYRIEGSLNSPKITANK